VFKIGEDEVWKLNLASTSRFKAILKELNFSLEKFEKEDMGRYIISVDNLDLLLNELNNIVVKLNNGLLPYFKYESNYLHSFEFCEKEEALSFAKSINLKIIGINEDENSSWQLFFDKGVKLKEGEALLLYKCKCWGDMLTMPWQIVCRVYNSKLWSMEVSDYINKLIKVVKLAMKKNKEIIILEK